MANFPFDPFPPEPAGPSTQLPVTRLEDTSISGSNVAINSIIDQPRTAEFKREMLTWRTPHLGYVQMYINPKSISIEDKKDLSTVRTKGGFVIQYAGESMTMISISGTTGSAGIEGINILESVFRSEQEAFEGVAIAFEERLSAMQFDSVLNTVNLSQRFDLALGAIDTLRGNGRPVPTLASLATNIELFFQGVLYRGYFKSFRVTESSESAGIFNYDINFEAYGKQGVRRNFTAWHKQPFVPAAPQANPYSFRDLVDPVSVGTIPLPNLATNTDDNGLNAREFEIPRLIGNSRNKRNTDIAIDDQGINIQGNDLTKKFRR